MENQEIAGVFRDIAKLLSLKNEKNFKFRAYQKASNVFKEFPCLAEELIKKGENCKNIRGIEEVPLKNGRTR